MLRFALIAVCVALAVAIPNSYDKKKGYGYALLKLFFNSVDYRFHPCRLKRAFVVDVFDIEMLYFISFLLKDFFF